MNNIGFDTLEEKEEDECLFELEYKLSEKEYLKFAFWHYYTNPIWLFHTILGIFSIIIYFLPTEDKNTFRLILGLLFTFFIPIFVLILSKINSKKTNLLNYSFFDDYMISISSKYMFQINWTDPAKITETKTVFYIRCKIYTTMIPKRVFEKRQEELQKFRSLIQKHNTIKFIQRL